MHWSSRLRARPGRADVDRGPFDNKRWAGRRKSDVPGLIIADKGAGPIRVAIRDTSSSGALVQIAAGNDGICVDDVPDSIKLVVRNSREYTEVWCVVVRRYGDCLGLRYTSQFRTFPLARRMLAGGGAKGR